MGPLVHPCALLTERVSAAVSLLYARWLQARATNRARWDFAVGEDFLFGLGASAAELDVLLERGYAERREGGIESRESSRRGHAPLRFGPCAVQLALTDAGAAWVEAQWEGLGGQANSPAVSRPTWDQEERVLRWGSDVIKRFLQPAEAQECLLAAFEEQHWMHRIDDPLPQIAGMSPKQRLHDTIKNINRHHRIRVLVFQGDGTGQGVCWREIVGTGC
jgi:hypothetical protein